MQTPLFSPGIRMVKLLFLTLEPHQVVPEPCPHPCPHSLVSLVPMSLSPSGVWDSTSPITSPSSHNSRFYFALFSLLDIKFEEKKSQMKAGFGS